jgi:hypothetical protein
MKTPFETLLARRAEALSEASCPYTSEELDRLVAQSLRQDGLAKHRQAPFTYPSRTRRFMPAACVAAVLFVATYTVTPASANPPARLMKEATCVETLNSVSLMLNDIHKTTLV